MPARVRDAGMSGRTALAAAGILAAWMMPTWIARAVWSSRMKK
jgi:hypothetical protein